MTGDARLKDYYARRAREYELIYEKPERQADLEILRKLLRKMLAGRDVLEIACGTGYWTQVSSQTAKSITATDVNEEVLQIARAKTYGCDVCFRKADALDLVPSLSVQFNAGLAAAWWSHLRKSQIRSFLDRWHQQFAPGSRLVFMDNKFVPGSNTPISRTDDEGNTYQLRGLQDGSEYEILKNFPNENEARAVLADSAVEFDWTELTYYWFLTYQIKP